MVYMQMQNQIPMATLTTMQLGGPAKNVVSVQNKNELVEAINFAKQTNLPILVLGDGSNMIVRDEGFAGLVILNRITGFEVLPDGVSVKIGAGENWDEVVGKSVELGLSGIEALSAIPGRAGATPVQNVGAYGQEISQTFVELQAYDTKTDDFVVLSKKDCQFSYRNSIFKPLAGRRYIIIDITLKLSKSQLKPPFYPRLQKYFDDNKITDYSPAQIRKAITEIRSAILPDPKKIANTGSFFKNPIVTEEDAENLLKIAPNAPHWPMPDSQVKFAAGWLVDQAGLKGYSAHGMKTYEKNALVFVNESAKSYKDLKAFQDEIVKKVYNKFGITLEQEPELL
ncbi:MAG TPA: UDP-N-acetylmuramate dehydrogenase [Candidatus Saccharimonadales bacterium]|nr:UDP-N-acetylmuramate dehydrogenase [Candidatus Saccharimonadales bacterium]